ncbi:hypothetical protein Tco_0983722, partial [Tanacetum coccineum]
THKSLYSILDEKYDAITCDFSPELEFLLVSKSHTAGPVCSLDTFEEDYKVESKVFDFLEINVNFFTCDTPLVMLFDGFSRLSSMEDDLFTYEVGVLEPSYFPCVEQPYDDLENDNFDIYEPRQCYDENERMFAEALDLKFRNHEKIDKEIKEGVVATWLIRSYRKQLEKYMEIKRRLEVNGVNTNVEFDPTYVEFAKWLASKFNNHKTIDRYTKDALWLYYIKGDDEEVLSDDEFFDLEEENLREGNEIAKIFRIEMNIFLFETPLCKEFKEFNYLLQIDVDVLTRDLPGFKTMKIIKIHGSMNGIMKCHGLIKNHGWNSEDRYCNGGDLPGMIRVGNMVYFQDYEWYEGLEDGDLKEETLNEKSILKGSWGHENRRGKNFCSWLKEIFRDYHELDYELMLKLKEYWWAKKEEEESSEDAWSNYLPDDEWKHYEHTTYIKTGINYDNDSIQTNQEWFDDHEPIGDDDDDIGDLDDYLISKDAPC